jgi:serine/threonine protein kinase
MPTPRSQADVELLEMLILGQLPVAEAERLAVEYADDARLVELAEAASACNDTLLDSLRNHQTQIDPVADHLVDRLVQRMTKSDSSAGSDTDTITQPAIASTGSAGRPTSLEYFQIQKVLGEGGMGTVYLADDTRLGRRVALKTLRRDLAANPAAKDRFLREARSAARLEHDHIIPIYYVGEADGTPFLAMPFLQGEPLDSRVKREGVDDQDPANQFARMSGEHKPLPIPEAIRIARQVALGLSVAHAQGLIHRDIKPANVWLEAPSGRVKILDFGLARSQTEAVHLTASGAIMGTPAYMAPKQARGKTVDARADLFSLGVMLYEMITGRRPFTGSDTMAILSSLALDEPPAPHTINSKCPAALSQLTMQLLAKQPEQRPASADVVAGQLAKLEIPVVETLPPTQVTPAADPWATIEDSDSTEQTPRLAKLATTERRKRRLLPYLAVAMLLGFVGIGLAFGGTIIRVVNNEGELVVTVDDPNTEVVVKDGGVEIRREENGKKRIFLVKAGKDGELEVREPGSDVVLVMEKFKLTRAGKIEVLVTSEKLAAARKKVDTDRLAAEYVLSIGGNPRLQANGKEVNPKAVGELPRGPFELRIVDLVQNAKVKDDGLAVFKDCKDLTHLFLQGTQVSDAGLAHLKSCKNLILLNLLKTKVTAEGIAALKKALPNCKIEWEVLSG